MIASEESFYVLRYDGEAFERATAEEITDDGVEDAFEVIGEWKLDEAGFGNVNEIVFRGHY